MALPNSNQPLSKGGSSAPRPITPRPTVPKPPSIPPQQDTSIFGGESKLSPDTIRNKWFMGGQSRPLPGGRGYLTLKDRAGMLKGLEEVARGSSITQRHVDSYLKKLREKKSGKVGEDQARIDQDIRWLRDQFKGPGK